MTREKYIKQLIKDSGYNLKDFAKEIKMPYSTLLSIVNHSLGGASIDNILKICLKLNIPVDSLRNGNIEKTNSNSLSTDELQYIKKYRTLDTHGKELINTILDKEIERINTTKN